MLPEPLLARHQLQADISVMALPWQCAALLRFSRTIDLLEYLSKVQHEAARMDSY